MLTTTRGHLWNLSSRSFICSLLLSLTCPAWSQKASRPVPVVPDRGALRMHTCEGARFKFEGVLGKRIAVNTSEWLLRAPQANPGMLEMFRVRDRQPVPNLVPWAGEFAGKYLISAVQALRMSDDPALRQQVRDTVTELISCQAEDGYLGPFPKATRLLGNWDLWGHYHCMQGLMLWYEDTGDDEALLACRRAADLICRIFLDGSKRVFDAGSHEMNMAAIHGLGQLHRLTGEERYLRMMREIEKDWERAGDYFRAGLNGVEFFQTPRPRWESLHDLQGLVELYRITGDVRYRQAFEHQWRSIARWDRHNTGGFSSGEQATGNPYSPGAIETCCTIAWMALTVDMLRLTGDPQCADELELSTFNGAVGAQHPSGRWWTYNTPMDGTREASAHSIVFQSRAGTPELNCCSVNAPRALGMLSEWAVMAEGDALTVNHFGPMTFRGQLKDGTSIELRTETQYPIAGKIKVHVTPVRPQEFTLKFRTPAWSRSASAKVNKKEVSGVTAGRYLEVKRRWKKGDTIDLEFDLALRFVTGDREALGKVSIYRGPLLLAYDQRYNLFDEGAIPPLDLKRIANPKAWTDVEPRGVVDAALAPWVLVEVAGAGNQPVRLCDFASAGAAGTRYRSWLPAKNCPPPPAVTREPGDGRPIASGAAVFKWSGPRRTNNLVSSYELVFAENPEFTPLLARQSNLSQNRALLEESFTRQFAPGKPYFWKVVTHNPHGTTEGSTGRFLIDPSLPALRMHSSNSIAPDGVLVKAALRGDAKPELGHLKNSPAYQAATGFDGTPDSAIELDGKSQMLTYDIGEFPEEDFTASVHVRLTALPEGRVGQVMSAWSVPMDDPLRLCVEKGKLFARMEAGQSYSTEGVPMATGRWYHVAAVKSGSELRLIVDGKSGPPVTVPLFLRSNARNIALGGNPHYSGNEFLAAAFSELAFYERALTKEDLNKLARPR